MDYPLKVAQELAGAPWFQLLQNREKEAGSEQKMSSTHTPYTIIFSFDGIHVSNNAWRAFFIQSEVAEAAAMLNMCEPNISDDPDVSINNMALDACCRQFA